MAQIAASIQPGLLTPVTSALKELSRYAEVLRKIRERIREELPIVDASLKWGRTIA